MMKHADGLLDSILKKKSVVFPSFFSKQQVISE